MNAGTALPPRSFLRHATRRAAFSLVEVTLAIGIVAFAVLPLVGLLSVGLNSYRNSNMRGPGAQGISQIASCLRLATADVDASTGKPTGGYTAAAPLDKAVLSSGTGVKWKTDGSTQPAQYVIYYDEDGNLTVPSNGGKRAQVVAMLALTAPNRTTGTFTPGTAQIAAAWPALRDPTYSNGAISFTNPQGHEETTIAFGPDSP